MFLKPFLVLLIIFGVVVYRLVIGLKYTTVKPTTQIHVDTKPRVAVIMLGFFRTYKHVYKNHHENLFEILNENFQVDVYVCGSWNMDDPRPWEKIHSVFKTVTVIPDTELDIMKELGGMSSDVYISSPASQVDQPAFGKIPIQMRVQYTWMRASRCFDTLKGVEENEKFEYKWVIKMRPDVAHFLPVPHPDTWNVSTLMIPAFHHPGFCDHFWITSRDVAELPFRIVWFWYGFTGSKQRILDVERALERMVDITGLQVEQRTDIGTVVVTYLPKTQKLNTMCFRTRRFKHAYKKCLAFSKTLT